ncbi:MAG: ABC transporter permease [Thermodesulfobacteriota bacterium]
MNARRVLAVARKEVLHIWRDPRSLGMALAIPALMMFLFGYALTLDVDNVPLAVWDQSGTPDSRELVSRFDGSRYFDVRLWADGYPEIERAILERRIMAALVVPRDFAPRLALTPPASVQFLLDGSDANTATIALGYAEGVAQAFTREDAARRAAGLGLPAIPDPIDVRSRVWFNEELESRNFIVPGLIAVIMMVISALLTSLTVAREWEQGTMEQLISTPVTGNELILGKLLPYFALGMTDLAVSVLMGKYVFDVPLRGSVALLVVSSGVFLAGALSMGMLFSIVARSQLLATQLAMMITFLPSFLLSGFVFAIGNMPRPIQAATHVVSARYLVTLLRGIYLKGVGLEVLAGELALLTVFGGAVLLVASRKFKKKLR